MGNMSAIPYTAQHKPFGEFIPDPSSSATSPAAILYQYLENACVRHHRQHLASFMTGFIPFEMNDLSACYDTCEEDSDSFYHVAMDLIHHDIQENISFSEFLHQHVLPQVTMFSPEMQNTLRVFISPNTGTGSVNLHGPHGYSQAPAVGNNPNPNAPPPANPSMPQAPRGGLEGTTLGVGHTTRSTATSRPMDYSAPRLAEQAPTISTGSAPMVAEMTAHVASPVSSAQLPASTSSATNNLDAEGNNSDVTIVEQIPATSNTASLLYPTMPRRQFPPSGNTFDPPLFSTRFSRPFDFQFTGNQPFGSLFTGPSTSSTTNPSTISGLLNMYEKEIGPAVPQETMSSPLTGSTPSHKAGPCSPASTSSLPPASPAVTWDPSTPIAERLAATTAAPTQVTSFTPVNPNAFAFPFIQHQPTYLSTISGSSSLQIPYIPVTHANMSTLQPTQPSLINNLMGPSLPPAPMHSSSSTVVTHVHAPPKFKGFINDEIPDLYVWYRRVERVAMRQNTHILDTLDDVTSGDANMFVQQLYNQRVYDTEQIRTLFFSHYSHLVSDSADTKFENLMFGSGIKKSDNETMESFITRFRLELSSAGISELELTPGSTLVKTLVGRFRMGLPEHLDKEFRAGNKQGVPFTSMQELYSHAIGVGKKFQKRRNTFPTSKEQQPPKHKPSPNKKPKHHKHHSPSKPLMPHKPALKQETKKVTFAAAKNTAEPRSRGMQSAPGLLSHVPKWPEPFPESKGKGKAVSSSVFSVPMLKKLVGTNRVNQAWTDGKKCVFCAKPLPTNMSPFEHYAKCTHLPDISE